MAEANHGEDRQRKHQSRGKGPSFLVGSSVIAGLDGHSHVGLVVEQNLADVNVPLVFVQDVEVVGYVPQFHHAGGAQVGDTLVRFADSLAFDRHERKCAHDGVTDHQSSNPNLLTIAVKLSLSFIH